MMKRSIGLLCLLLDGGFALLLRLFGFLFLLYVKLRFYQIFARVLPVCSDDEQIQ